MSTILTKPPEPTDVSLPLETQAIANNGSNAVNTIDRDGLSYVAQRLPRVTFSRRFVFGFALILATIITSMVLLWEHPALNDAMSGINRARYDLAMYQYMTPGVLSKAKVFILGDSRPAYGIQAHVVAKALGLKQWDVVNLAQAGLDYQAMDYYMAHVPHFMDKGNVWVIGTEDHLMLHERSWRQQRFLPKDSVAGFVERALQLMVFPDYYSVLNQIKERGNWVLANWAIATDLHMPNPVTPWYIGANGAWCKPGVVERHLQMPLDQNELPSKFLSDYGDKVPSDHQYRLFEARIRKAQAHGVHVVFVHLPLHPVYFGSLKTNPHYVLLSNQGNNAYAKMAKQYHIPMISCLHAEQCHFDLSGFADPYHLNGQGSHQFSVWFGQQLKRQLAQHHIVLKKESY